MSTVIFYHECAEQLCVWQEVIYVPVLALTGASVAPQTCCKATRAKSTSYVAVETWLETYFPGSTDFNIRLDWYRQQEHVRARRVVNR